MKIAECEVVRVLLSKWPSPNRGRAGTLPSQERRASGARPRVPRAPMLPPTHDHGQVQGRCWRTVARGLCRLGPPVQRQKWTKRGTLHKLLPASCSLAQSPAVSCAPLQGAAAPPDP
eukprot:15470042-Alexandrium_andersonii.AAC.1